ncbi:MAG: DUF58 domain-containing protein [Blautia marasmi]
MHWKNSARTGDLLVRKQMPEELFETIVILVISNPRGYGKTAADKRTIYWKLPSPFCRTVI